MSIFMHHELDGWIEEDLYKRTDSLIDRWGEGDRNFTIAEIEDLLELCCHAENAATKYVLGAHYRYLFKIQSNEREELEQLLKRQKRKIARENGTAK